MPLTSSVVTQRYQISGSFVARKKFRCSEKMSKFPLGQLQFYIFAEIVFGVRCTLKKTQKFVFVAYVYWCDWYEWNKTAQQKKKIDVSFWYKASRQPREKVTYIPPLYTLLKYPVLPSFEDQLSDGLIIYYGLRINLVFHYLAGIRSAFKHKNWIIFYYLCSLQNLEGIPPVGKYLWTV